MIEAMATLRMTEAERARDIHAVLANVQEGAEIVVEQDHHPVAVIRSPLPKGRLLSDRAVFHHRCPNWCMGSTGRTRRIEGGAAGRSSMI
ncbi:MAG: hypothetical protein WBW33_01960 [Bryobacteraceae bacterium]